MLSQLYSVLDLGFLSQCRLHLDLFVLGLVSKSSRLFKLRQKVMASCKA